MRDPNQNSLFNTVRNERRSPGEREKMWSRRHRTTSTIVSRREYSCLSVITSCPESNCHAVSQTTQHYILHIPENHATETTKKFFVRIRHSQHNSPSTRNYLPLVLLRPLAQWCPRLRRLPRLRRPWRLRALGCCGSIQPRQRVPGEKKKEKLAHRQKKI